PRRHLPRLAAPRPGLAGEVPFGGQDQLEVLVDQPFDEGADGHHGLSGPDGVGELGGEDGGQTLGPQVLGDVPGTARAHHRGDDGPALGGRRSRSFAASPGFPEYPGWVVEAVVRSTSVSRPKAARENQGRPPSRACPFASDSGTKLAAPTSIGRPPPAAALDQAAARNSSVVATSSSARARAFSGSRPRKRAPSGSTSATCSTPSPSTGLRDSIPSAAIPSAIRSSRSRTPGSSSARARARSRTSSVSRISRQGGASRPRGAGSRERWSATEK